jgi:hypothetical protein
MECLSKTIEKISGFIDNEFETAKHEEDIRAIADLVRALADLVEAISRGKE